MTISACNRNHDQRYYKTLVISRTESRKYGFLVDLVRQGQRDPVFWLQNCNLGDLVPRGFDSDLDPENLVFTENVECPRCFETFEGTFQDDSSSLSVQDMAVAPFGDHECPECCHRFITTLSGWMMFGEAG